MVGVRQFDEQAVLERALALFWRQGPAATSMPALAQATGVQRGSLYNAYGDKEALFLKAFDLYAARFLSAVENGLVGRDARAVLERFFEAAIANMTAGSPSRGCLTTKTANDGSLAEPRIRERVQGLIRDLEALVAGALAPLEGELTLSVAETATLAVAFTRGLAVMERIHGDPPQLRATASAFVRAVTRSGP
ncbi:TetR/AcrR family transcriptional regulator [Methylobacterium nonmethylotrophicum]|uniref:TetR/AcrR family transcriptional regulator n=1 Tax=Methylobacterium nonmethylotrophicum TaxID=1141884 RepID=A0A4Z0NJ85_9HYPH|nr:TetR/AcrR family transcriptional regulator [Methylobacterium nonmethylotrophicum]TGD96063.1 TetR/AcrR family transcriptional regulator [Methylobacterium nonmethylotrophicum]